jgi:hypothetical protein
MVAFNFKNPLYVSRNFSFLLKLFMITYNITKNYQTVAFNLKVIIILCLFKKLIQQRENHDNIYKKGCLLAAEEWFHNNLLSVTFLMLALSFSQVSDECCI